MSAGLHLNPVPARVVKARHDLRNPLGEVIGFAEVLREESADLGHAELQPALSSLSADAHALLDQLDAALEIDNLRFHPESVDALRSAISSYNQRVSAAALELSARCAALPGRPFLEDFTRITTAAGHLAERAPVLLADLYDDGAVAEGSPGSVPSDPIADVGGGDTIFIHRTTARSSADSTGTIFFKRPTASPATGAAILVVDDNEANRALLTRRLERHGHTVAHAEDGNRALELVRRRRFDLVLLDVLMPNMTGHEVLEVLKADPILRHLPVIMITGLDDLESLVRCIECGAEDYLTKPFDPVLLNARIGACLEKKRLRDKEQELLRQVRQEQEKSEALLLNILPRSIADRLKGGESLIVDTLSEVTVLFADLVGFTELSARITGAEMVRLLDELFTTFDLLAQQQGLEKIKTIGDAYMVVGGLPVPRADHAHAVAELALNMMEAVKAKFSSGGNPIQIRIGISSGPVVAGVIGRNKFSYDLWGDTVNTASRMESYGEPGAIQVSPETFKLLEADYTFTRRELSNVKGKGDLTASLLIGRRR